MADQVTLKNGDRLTGTIVQSDVKTLLVKTEFAGDVNIQWDAVTANVSITRNYRFTFDATAATKLKNWLGWQVTYSDRYVTNPTSGLKGSD